MANPSGRKKFQSSYNLSEDLKYKRVFIQNFSDWFPGQSFRPRRDMAYRKQ